MPTEPDAVERVGRPSAVPMAWHGQAHVVGWLEGAEQLGEVKSTLLLGHQGTHADPRPLQINTAGLEPSSARLVVYLDEIDEEHEPDFEACATIPFEMLGASEVYSRELEGRTVAATVHQEPHKDIRPTSN